MAVTEPKVGYPYMPPIMAAVGLIVVFFSTVVIVVKNVEKKRGGVS